MFGFDIADHWHQHAVINFHGESEVDGLRMHDALANETPGHGGVFRQGDGEGAQGIECGSGFLVRSLLFPVGEERIQIHPDAHGGQRPGPTAAHGIRHGDAHGTGRGGAVLFQFGHEGLEILHRDPPARAAARHGGKVRRIQPDLLHPRPEPGGNVMRPGGIHRHGKSG